MRDRFIAKLEELATLNKDIVLVTGDLGFGVFDSFRENLSEQFLNAGVAEQNMTGLASGLALSGKIVFTYSIANFSTLRCLEQIRNDACYHDANVKVVSIGGGFSYGALGVSHHATEDLAIMRSIPNLLCLAPSTLHEAAKATEAVVDHQGSCFLRLDKSHGTEEQELLEPFVIGKLRTIRDGGDLTLITCGGILEEVQQAADRLKEQHGIQARILSMHTLSTMDVEGITRAVEETEHVITVEEHSIVGGLGSAVAEVCMDHGLKPRSFNRIALRDGFSSIVGSQNYLRTRYGLDADAIFKVASQVKGVN